MNRRTHLARIFPNEDPALRLVCNVGAETHERWSCEQRDPNGPQ
ncbi:MAG: transposase [Ferrimicrobium sp.]